MIDMTYDPDAEAVYIHLSRGKLVEQRKLDRSSTIWMPTVVCSVRNPVCQRGSRRQRLAECDAA